MCSRKAKLYCNERKSNGVESAVRVRQIHLDRTASTMKPGAFVTYPVYAVLQNFCIQIQRRHIYSKHKPVGFLPVEYEDGGCDVEEHEQVKCCETGGMVRD